MWTGGLRERWIAPGISSFYPGYFALVMATGIISNSFWVLDHRLLSNVLFAVNLAAYPLLLAVSAARLIYFPRRFWADLINPRVVFTFFTLVAGTDVIGVQFFLRNQHSIAALLWVMALLLWVALSYFSFTVLALISDEHGVDVVHGGWLIAIVGTESLVLLGALLAPDFGSLAEFTFLTVFALWGVGIVLYGIFLTLFSYRIFFSPIEPEDMHPLFWVVMGAAAIAANAGSTLIVAKPELEFLKAMRPFVEGTTLVLWAWATWLIPLFFGFGFWRHVVRKHPLKYSPMFWSLVFPLGMYTVATYRLSKASDFPPLLNFSKTMIWVAFASWLITMSGLLLHSRRSFRVARLPIAEALPVAAVD